MITNDAICTWEIKSRIARACVALNNKKTLFTSKLGSNLRKKQVLHIWGTVIYGAERWTLWEVDQKYLESFEMLCWRRIEISWYDRAINEEALE